MKIAIVHDDLMRRGGAEKVALAFHKIYPEAPIYTLCYQPELTYPEFKEANVITSEYQKMVKDEDRMKKLFYPFGYLAMRRLKIKGYDKVLLSSTYASKYADFDRNTEIINYIHNPFRIAWYPESYDSYNEKSGIKKALYDRVLKNIRKLDYRHTRKADKIIVNSRVVQQRVREIYGREADALVNPPVDLSDFSGIASVNKGDYYLVVSRLETYKRVDLVVKAFNRMGKKLHIVGKGVEEDRLKSMAKENVVFRQGLSMKELAEEYAGASAFIFPQEEDFGITPLEANASGIPVIAYGKGGILETMVPLDPSNSGKASAIFFNDQTEDSLIAAVERFENNRSAFDMDSIIENANRFSIERFEREIRRVVEG